MADYMVERKFNPKTSEWFLVAWNYRNGQEEGMLAEGKVPGRDFVMIDSENSAERAKSQAGAYFDGTHKTPGPIDTWVKSMTSG